MRKAMKWLCMLSLSAAVLLGIPGRAYADTEEEQSQQELNMESDENDPDENDPEEADPMAEDVQIYHPAESKIESGNRVWFYNLAGGVANGDFIIVESDGHWGIIDSGHRYSSEPIVDADGTSYEVPFYYEDGTLAGYSVQAEGRNGRDAAIYMIETLGVTHLDFIISSHAHSDHSGGIPDIANLLLEDETGVHYLVDENTVYLKKKYHHVNSLNDDLGDELREDSWHTQAYEYAAIEAVKNRGGTVVDVSNGLMTSEDPEEPSDMQEIVDAISTNPYLREVTYYQGDLEDYYDNYIEFTFGEFQMRLYNLYAIAGNNKDDNPNSIATVIVNGGKRLFTAGDLTVMYEAQQKVARAVYNDFGGIDVMKSSDHGANLAFAKEMIDLFQPDCFITPNIRTSVTAMDTTGGYFSALYYSKTNYGTSAYEVGASDKGIVAEFRDGEIQILEATGEKEDAVLISAASCLNQVVKKGEGWVTWKQMVGPNATTAEFYYFRDNVPVTGWLKQEEATYYFQENGFMLRGWLEEDGKKYFFKGDGTMQTGWKKEDDLFYYLDPETGASVTGWIKDTKGTYFLLPDQHVLTGFHMIDGEGYFFKENGALKTGWVQLEDGWRYFGEDGRMLDGLTKIGEKIYYLENGFMAKGWAEINGEYYYFDSEGVMVTGWNKIGTGAYCFRKDGRLRTGWFMLDGNWYYSAANGRRVDGWLQDGGSWYYMDQWDGMHKGWLTLGANNYYFGTNGAMVTGWKQMSGRWHFFTKEGVLTKGWLSFGNDWYYFDQNGDMVTGWKALGRKWYYFKADGTMKTGWLQADGKWFYMDEKGVMTTGWKQLGENWYYFSKSGYMLTGQQTIGRRTYNFGSDGVYVEE